MSPESLIASGSSRTTVLSIAALLPRRLGARLQVAAPSSRLCKSAQELLHVVRTGGTRMVVGDPSYDDGRCGDVMRLIRGQFPSVALLAYISLSADSVSHTVRAAASGIADCILYQYDDSPQRFAELIARARDASLITAMLDTLRPELDRLAEPWRDAVSDVYRRPMRYLVTGDLAAAVNTTRQTLHRRLQQAGLRSPRLLVGSGRVLRATELLRDPSRTVCQTANQLGYHRPEHLTAMLKLLAGIQVRDLRQGVQANRITSEIARRLTSRDPYPALAGAG